MKKTIIALSVCLVLLCLASAASAGVHGHFVSEDDGTFLIILSEPISDSLGGVYMGNDMFLMSLDRADNEDGTTRVYTPLYESTAIIDLLLRYEDDSEQVALVTGTLQRFDMDGALMEDQSLPDMQDVRYIRQEVPAVTELQGTRWLRYTMTISGADRSLSLRRFGDRIFRYGVKTRARFPITPREPILLPTKRTAIIWCCRLKRAIP